MKGCKYFRKLIDQAEKPDLLPFDVSAHIGQCADCERFANGHTGLRRLLADGARVNVPINFDAVLSARLAGVKGRSLFWWLGSPGFLRLGAATAGVVAMLVVAQYTGWLSNNQPPTSDAVATQGPTPVQPQSPEVVLIPLSPGTRSETVASVRSSYRKPSIGRRTVPVSGEIPGEYITVEDGGVVLLRGRNGDADVQMPTVSVGAQPLLYVSAGQRTARSVGTSF